MAGSGEPDAGCLSALSCFKKRGKTRLELSRSPKRAPITVSPTSNVAGAPASTTVADQEPFSILSHAEATLSTPAGFHAPPSASNELTPTNVALSCDQFPDVSATRLPLDLWQEAYAEVNEKTRKWIDGIASVNDNEDPVKELVELVRCSEEKHKGKALKLKIGNREILWRDYANRVVSVLTAIGDIVITFAPAPSSTVWSAVKVLLAANVSQCEDLVAIMGCTDMVLCLVRRGRVYEEVYIGEPPIPTTQEDLKANLVRAYTTCLEFIAFVNEEMQQGNLRRFADALLDPGYGEQRLSELKALEQELEYAARACEAKEGDEHRRLLRSLEGPLKRVDNNITAVLKELESNDIRNAMEYISTVPVGSYHNDKRACRTKDTCEWLVCHPKFLMWEGLACSSVFWLQGRIGTGKSFLSSKVIDRYLIHDTTTSQRPSAKDEGFAFFYCSSSDPTRRDVRSILRSYIRQLSELPGRPESVHRASYTLYERKRRIQSDISFDDCEATLVDIINSYPRTTLVLDALDECRKDNRGQLAQLFKRLVQKSKRLLKIFIASRPESDISDYLRSFRGLQTMVSISTSDNWGDIEKYVTVEMAAFSANWKSITPETKQLVKETLVRMSDGMFRWTYLQWEQLKEYSTNSDIKRRLGKLPNTLSAAYDEMYDQYDPEGFERVMLQRAVRWVMYAHKPLDSCTLLSAIRVESEKIDGARALDQSDLTEHTLETVCRHLIVKDLDLGIWRFPHASVAEYFWTKSEPWVKDAQAEITVVLINCIIDCGAACPSVWKYEMFLDTICLSPWLLEGDIPNNILDPRHPLQIYTQLNWYHHVRGISKQDAKAVDVVRALKRFLGENGCQMSSREYQLFWKYVRASSHSHYRYCYERTYSTYRNGSSASRKTCMYTDASPATMSVFGVVVFGLHRLLSGWWDNNLDVSSLVNHENTDLLTMAVDYGHADLCEYLIDRAGDNSSNDETTHLNGNVLHQPWIINLLHLSIYRRHIDVTRTLLENGANPNQYINSQSLLCWAVGIGSEYVKLLLENGADPNIRGTFETNPSDDCEFYYALWSAADKGDVTSLKLLVERGADVDSFHLKTSLFFAVRHGHLDCARFLVEQGTDVNPSCYNDSLINAIYFGNLNCAYFLIERGADVNAMNIDLSPLIAAVSEGYTEFSRFLIDCGADVNMEVEDRFDSCPLAAAACRGKLDLTRLLIENGADVDMKLKTGGGSPLAVAVSRGRLDCARILVENGANAHAHLEFGSYSCVLAAAIFGNWPSFETIRYLLEEKNVDPTQLAFVRPDINQERVKVGSQCWWKYQTFPKEEKRKITKYLLELQLDPRIWTRLRIDHDLVSSDARSFTRSDGSDCGVSRETEILTNASPG